METINRINLYQQRDFRFIDSLDDVIVRLSYKRREKGMKTLLFCGSDPGVGTTTVLINLAIALAQGKNKTLLIDSDMRKKSQHKHLSGQQRPGLSDFLEGKVPMESIIYPTSEEQLNYVPSGGEAAHTSRLLGADKFVAMQKLLSREYDLILLDSPSMEAANDALALSQVADGIILVAAPAYSSKKNLKKMKIALGGEDGGKILGVVVTKVTKLDYRTYMNHYDYFAKQKYQIKSGRRPGK